MDPCPALLGALVSGVIDGLYVLGTTEMTYRNGQSTEGGAAHGCSRNIASRVQFLLCCVVFCYLYFSFVEFQFICLRFCVYFWFLDFMLRLLS